MPSTKSKPDETLFQGLRTRLLDVATKGGTVHIINSTNTDYLCGMFLVNRKDRIMHIGTFHNSQKEWLLPPNCEECVLLLMSAPENVYCDAKI